VSHLMKEEGISMQVRGSGSERLDPHISLNIFPFVRKKNQVLFKSLQVLAGPFTSGGVRISPDRLSSISIFILLTTYQTPKQAKPSPDFSMQSPETSLLAASVEINSTANRKSDQYQWQP
jgi:hypothetical protein